MGVTCVETKNLNKILEWLALFIDFADTGLSSNKK